MTGLAHMEQVLTGAQDIFRSCIWQEALVFLNCQWGSRDEASTEAAHHEKEITAILDICKRLAVADVSDGRDDFCSDLVFVATSNL